VPLLRWRKKLKRAAQECEDMLRGCKQRALEDEETKKQVREYSFPRRVAHATKSLVSSFINHNSDECSSKALVQRFERLAEGADDFLRYVQLGGTPKQYMFFDPLISNLFAGKFVEYKTMQHGSQYHYFAIRPMSFEERGLEAMLSFIYEDCKAPHNSFRLGFMLRLSESTDIIGIAIKCLHLVTPHFKSTAEIVMKQLTQLPTQDFSWSSQCNTTYVRNAHWNNVHDTLTRWFRPDPLCCKGYDYEHKLPACSTTADASSTLSNIFPEPVCEVFLQRHISVSEYNNMQGSSTSCSSSSSQEDAQAKLGVLFIPHDGVVDDLTNTTGVEIQSSATEAIDGKKQPRTLVNVHPHQLDEMLIPKAIDYLNNSGATICQISWRSRHGSAHLCVEKTTKQMTRTRRVTRTAGRNKSSKGLQLEDQIKKEQWKQVTADFLKLMAVRKSDSLHGSITKWLDRW
jgi:hypothetical protein